MTGYNTISDYSGEGVMPLLYSLRDSIPFCFEGILLSIFFVLFAGQYFITKAKTGKGKALASLTISSFILIPLSSILALAQLVTFMTVLLWTFISIISFALSLLMDDW